MRKVKQIDDAENQELLEQYVKNGLKDRDNIDFDFEADLIKMIRKLNVTRLVNNDREYLDNFTKSVIGLYRKFYLGDVVFAGKREADRFFRLFTEGANAS